MASQQTLVTYFVEVFDSRDGSSRGVSGVSERRVFRMILDVGDGQATQQQFPDPRGFVEERIPQGSPHPWNGLSFASDYSVVERETPNRWLMAVEYKATHGPSDMPLTPAGTPWRLSVRGVAFSFELRETYPPAEGTIVPAFGQTGQTKLIATTQFEEVDVYPDGELHFTATVSRYDSSDPPKLLTATIKLARTAALNHQPQVDESGGLGATWTRTLNAFDFDNMFAINNVLKTVNVNPFMGAPPGHVKFDSFGLDAVDAIVAPGRPNPGQAYRVSVGFVMSDEAYTPLKLHPTFKDKEGNETPVFVPTPNGLALYAEDFIVKRLKSYGELFNILGALPI